MAREGKNPWDDFQPVGGPPKRKRAGLLGKLMIILFFTAGGAGLAWGAMFLIKTSDDLYHRRRQSTYNQLSEPEKTERIFLWCNVAAVVGAFSGAGFALRTLKESRE